MGWVGVVSAGERAPVGEGFLSGWVVRDSGCSCSFAVLPPSELLPVAYLGFSKEAAEGVGCGEGGWATSLEKKYFCPQNHKLGCIILMQFLTGKNTDSH